jgi:hypothetical protein
MAQNLDVEYDALRESMKNYFLHEPYEFFTVVHSFEHLASKKILVLCDILDISFLWII